jgi:hypothetical protein
MNAHGVGSAWRCENNEYHVLLIVDDYPRFVIYVDGTRGLTVARNG